MSATRVGKWTIMSDERFNGEQLPPKMESKLALLQQAAT